MFGLIQYKKRLAAIRAELVEIEEDMATLPVPPPVGVEPPTGLREIAEAVSKVSRILVRVIDSLPG